MDASDHYRGRDDGEGRGGSREGRGGPVPGGDLASGGGRDRVTLESGDDEEMIGSRGDPATRSGGEDVEMTGSGMGDWKSDIEVGGAEGGRGDVMDEGGLGMDGWSDVVDDED